MSRVLNLQTAATEHMQEGAIRLRLEGSAATKWASVEQRSADMEAFQQGRQAVDRFGCIVA